MSDANPNPSPPGRSSSKRLEQAGASDTSITAIHAQLMREKPEPTEGFSPIPIFILFVFSALIFFAGIYLGTQSGEFSPLAFDVTRNYKAPPPDAGPTVKDPMREGQRAYNQSCVACHQATGQGAPPAFPPLIGTSYVLGNEEWLIRAVLHGLSGPIDVDGTTFNGVMPGHLALRWNAEKVAYALTYVRASWGNAAPPVTPEKVAEVMSTVGNRTAPWTAAELEQFR